MENQIEAKRWEVAEQMKMLGRRLESEDDSDLVLWVIPSALACAHRPLRHHPRYGGSGQAIPAEAKPLILEWVEGIRIEGIASIICFMHDRDLGCYRQIDLRGSNILEFLVREGFRVCHLPWVDPAHSRTDPVKKERA
jgi:hypothetical protein